jgi:hypothetical protein
MLGQEPVQPASSEIATVPVLPASILEGGQTSSEVVLGVLGTVSMAALAYHGYKRNNSIGWAVAWALLGGAVPIISLPIAIAQGFGKPAGSA